MIKPINNNFTIITPYEIERHNIKTIAARKKGDWFIVSNGKLEQMSIYKKIFCYLFFFYRFKVIHDVQAVVNKILPNPELAKEIGGKTTASTYRFLLGFQRLELEKNITKNASKIFLQELKEAHLNLALKNFQPISAGCSGSYRIYRPELFSDVGNKILKKAHNLFIFKPTDENPNSRERPGFGIEVKKLLLSTVLSPLAGDALTMNGSEAFIAETFAYKLGSFIKDTAKQYVRSGIATEEEKFWLNKFDPVCETHAVHLTMDNRRRFGSLARWVNGPVKMATEYFNISRHGYFASWSAKSIPRVHFGTLRIFDKWIHNGDRHLENLLCATDADGHLENMYYIDHGYCMPPKTPSPLAYIQIKNFQVLNRLNIANDRLSGWDRFLIESGYKNRDRLYQMALDHYNHHLPSDLELNKQRALTFKRSLEYLHEISQNPRTTYKEIMNLSKAKELESA